jgi:hypothetical protein
MSLAGCCCASVITREWMQAQQDDILSAREELSLHSHNTTHSQQKFDLSTNISFLCPQLPTDTFYVSFGQVLRNISLCL